MIISQASLSAKHGMYKADCILPYRLLRALVDKPELALPVLNDVLFDLVCCLRQQIADLGGLGSTQAKSTKLVKSRGVSAADDPLKKTTKKGALKAEILQSSNLFFTSLDSEILWKWVTDVLKDSFGQLSATKNSENEDKAPKSEEEALTVAKERDEVEESDHQDIVRFSSPATELVESNESQLVEREVQLTEGEDLPGEQETKGGERNSQPDELQTHSNSMQESTSSSTAGLGADKRNLLFVLDLVRFLMQSLPLVSGVARVILSELWHTRDCVPLYFIVFFLAGVT